MGGKITTKQRKALKTGKTCIYQVLQLNNVEIATCSSEKNIDIWNLETGLIDITLTGYSTPVTSLVYLKDGRLASGSYEKSIKIWTYDNHRCDFVMMAHDAPIRCIIQLKNGDLASCSDDKTIRILDMRSMWFPIRFTEHTGPVRSLAELTDGRLVSGSDDKTIKVWNLQRKKLEGSIDCEEKVTSLLVVNRSGLLLVGCKKIKIFNMKNREQYVNVHVLPGHDSEINIMINVGVDGKRVVSGGMKDVRIWNLQTKVMEAKLDGHKKGTYGMEILTDGKLITSGGDGQLKLWDVLGDNCLINLKTGEIEGKKEDEKDFDEEVSEDKITYAYKDEVKKFKVEDIEKNISKNKGSNNNKNFKSNSNNNKISNISSGSSRPPARPPARNAPKPNNNTNSRGPARPPTGNNNSEDPNYSKSSLERKGWVIVEQTYNWNC